MGDQPAIVSGVPGESSPDMIIDPSVRHRIQCTGDHLQGSTLSSATITTEEQRESGGWGKFRRTAESAVALIEMFAELDDSLIKYGSTD